MEKYKLRLFSREKIRYFIGEHRRFDLKALSKVSGGFRSSTSSEHFSFTFLRNGKINELWIDEDGTISMD